MQTLRSALVPLLMFSFAIAASAATKVHTVALGAVRKVSYTPPDSAKSSASDDASTLKVRPLIVDGRQKEWIVGDMHEVTDRSFAVRRVLHLNDALPGETGAHWSWQPGPWLLVDRMTGHIAALHLPDFDPAISNAVWYRDYAAYCGLNASGKNLYAVVAQLGARKPVVQKEISKWIADDHAHPACSPAEWQRQPVRVTFQPTGGSGVSFEIVGGAAALIEEGDNSDADDSSEK